MKKLDLFQVGTETVGGTSQQEYMCGASIVSCFFTPWGFAGVALFCLSSDSSN